MYLIFLLYPFEGFCTINLEHKGAAVSTVLAEKNLSDTAAGNGKYLLALAIRAVKHSKQLYMSIRYKN